MKLNPVFDNTDLQYMNAYWFIFSGDKLLLIDRKGTPEVPYAREPGDMGIKLSDIYQIGVMEGKNCYSAYPADGQNIDAGFMQVGLRQVFGLIPDEMFWAAGRAYHLQNWVKSNRFCGCCGKEMKAAGEERALKCSGCGNTVYPRISPAIITAVVKGEEILLARAKRFPEGLYSVIAGFVEPGETLEECVAREVREEVGIEVRNIRYFSSQPWPFPDSLMIAFTAEYSSGEIAIDNVEIEAAGWYTRDNLPDIPGKLSVARKLIDWYISMK